MPIKDCDGLETKFDTCIGTKPVCEKCDEYADAAYAGAVCVPGA